MSSSWYPRGSVHWDVYLKIIALNSRIMDLKTKVIWRTFHHEKSRWRDETQGENQTKPTSQTTYKFEVDLKSPLLWSMQWPMIYPVTHCICIVTPRGVAHPLYFLKYSCCRLELLCYCYDHLKGLLRPWCFYWWYSAECWFICYPRVTHEHKPTGPIVYSCTRCWELALYCARQSTPSPSPAPTYW